MRAPRRFVSYRSSRGAMLTGTAQWGYCGLPADVDVYLIFGAGSRARAAPSGYGRATFVADSYRGAVLRWSLAGELGGCVLQSWWLVLAICG